MREDRGQQFTRFLLTLQLLLVRTWVPFVMAMCLMLHGCALSMGDLEWSNPDANVVSICDKPLDVGPGIDLWAFNSQTGRLVTAEQPLELPGCHVFIPSVVECVDIFRQRDGWAYVSDRFLQRWKLRLRLLPLPISTTSQRS